MFSAVTSAPPQSGAGIWALTAALHEGRFGGLVSRWVYVAGGLTPVALAITGLGITVGFHRLFTHRSFKTGRVVRGGMAIAGSMAIEGPIVSWVADHRKHHAFSDREGDPHSPHVDQAPGWRGARWPS